MAVLDGQYLQPSEGGIDNPYLTIDHDEFAWVDIPQESYAGLLAGAGDPLETHWPVEANGTEIDAQPLNAYLFDYYYRIHISPELLDLGNLLSSQTRNVYLWNAYLEPKLLQSVDTTGFDGISMIEPEPAPTYFAGLEERTYQVTVSTNGPPVIDASAIFDFDNANDPRLIITGRRVVIWPFKPLVDYVEKLEWNTDVIPTFNGEQRLALRMAPRQQLNHRFHLSERQYSRAKAISTQWAHRIYGIPVWSEASRVASIPLGATEILMDTAHADYRPGSLAMVWESDESNEALEIDSILPDRLVLRLPTDRTFATPQVMPMRFARTMNGTEFNRIGIGHTFAAASFDITDNIDLSESGDYVQYRGHDVLLDCPVLLTELTEKIARSIDVFDNGSGIVEVDIQNAYVSHLMTATFDTHSRAERWKLRQFLARMKGRRGTFWLPSFNRDLALLDVITTAALSMNVKPIGYPLYLGVTDIMVELNSGARYFNRITSGAAVGDVEVLSFTNTFPVQINPPDVRRISFMALSRFDSDAIELHHVVLQIARTAVPVREVPA